jgi:hypothetical protein
MMKIAMQPDPRDYEIRIWYSAEKGDECFIAQVVGWPGIMAHGETREEAARQIQLPPNDMEPKAFFRFNDSIRRWTNPPWRTIQRFNDSTF